MKAIIYIFGVILAVIASPFVAFLLAAYTFFIATIAFVQGSHNGMINILYKENAKELEEEPQDMWERHIKRIADKSKLN